MPFSRDRPQVGVFGRLPGPGSGKSRLAIDVGPDRARALAEAFLGDVLARADAVAPERTWWWIAPDEGPRAGPGGAATIEAAAGSGIVPARVRLEVQRGDHLGARMEHALATMLTEGPALLVGADAPDAPLAAVIHAFAWLGDDADRGGRPRLVFGPAEDGGFWLVGADTPLDGLLAARTAWGTGDVLARTLADAAAAGRRWDVHLLDPWSDVDTGRDLEALAARLAAARARGEAARPGWPGRTAALVLGNSSSSCGSR